MPALIDIAKAFLTSKGWVYDTSSEAAVLRLGFDGRGGRFPCYVECHEELGQLVFFCLRPGSVPAAQRPKVAEYLMRVNCRLNVGGFELNFDDGTVRFRSGIDVEGRGLDAVLLSHLALLSVATMDKFMPGIDAVLAGTAAQAALEALPLDPAED